MHVRRLSALALGVAAAAAAFAPASASASTQQSQFVLVCSKNLDPYAINLPGYTNCMIAVAGAEITTIGTCTAAYTPGQPPLGTGAVAATQTYVTCLT